MSTAVLKNALSGETVRVTSAKGKFRRGKVIDVWVDPQMKPLCAIGNENPEWIPIVVNNNAVLDENGEKPEYPIGILSR